MIIAIDFDGTIAKTLYPEIIELMPEARYINEWRRMGHKIILWTCREDEPLRMALSFCYEHGIHFDAVNANLPSQYNTDPRKIGADIYIDDKMPMPVSEQWNKVNEMLSSKKKVAMPIAPVIVNKSMPGRAKRR